MATPQESNKLMSLFNAKYKQTFGKTYRLNRNTAKWAARDIIDSFGYDDCAAGMEWAFRVRLDEFTWEWFAGNIDRLLAAKQIAERDEQARVDRRKRAKEWLNE